MLLAAQAGEYGGYAMHNVDPLIVSRYFKKSIGGYTVDPTIQSMARFERLNLRDALAARRYGTWDVIEMNHAAV